jgi:hypothetical protein
MAMSASEFTRRRQEEAQLYISRRKARDASEVTMKNQAMSSGNVFRRGTGAAIAHSETFGASKKGIGETLVEENCCRTVVTTGSHTDAGSTGILQAAQKCAVCRDPDPAFYRGVILSVNQYDRSKAPFSQNITATICTRCSLFYPVAGRVTQAACSCTDTPESLISMRF